MHSATSIRWRLAVLIMAEKSFRPPNKHVWAYACLACGHYESQHLMIDNALFRCPCGCEIDQRSPMMKLFDRPADEAPFLPGTPAGGDA